MEFDPLVMAAVLGLVNFIKALGLSGKAVTVVSMIVGVMASIASSVLDAATFMLIRDGVLLGLAAAGFYDAGSGLAKAVSRR